MREKLNASTRSKVYRQIGTGGWRKSGFFTFSYSSTAFRRWMAAQLGTESLSILSVGCGAGELENDLAESRHRVVGVDLSYPMLKRAAQAGLKLAVQADARLLPFDAASFDVVMFVESIGHLSLDEVFKEAHRMLRSSGRVLVTTYAPHMSVHGRYRKFGSKEIVPPLREAGFRIDRQQFLKPKRSEIIMVPSADQASLLYVAATRENSAID